MRTSTSSRRLLGVLLLGVALGSTSCGGGGGGGGNSTFTFVPSSDATLTTTGGVSPPPGLVVGQSVATGRVAGVRFGIFPFLGSTDTILSARLRVRQMSVTGSPYAMHGNVVVDFVDFGLSLGAGDDAPLILAPAVGTLSSSATLGFKEVDVTAQVAAAAAADDLTADFVLRFGALLLGPGTDYVSFEDAAGGLGSADGPELIVTYR